MKRIIEISTHREGNRLRSDHVLAAGQLLAPDYPRFRHGIVAIPVGERARQEHGGPLVPGPWAATYGLASCIDNHGGTGAEARRKREAGLEHTVRAGSLVRIDGVVYVVADASRGRGEHLVLTQLFPSTL